VPLGEDVPADRQSEAGALAGRLGREKRLEQFVPEFGRDPGAVVAHPDFDFAAKIACRDLQHRTEGVARLAPSLVGGIKSIAEQVQEDPRHVLRHQLDRSDLGIKLALQVDVEVLVLRAGAMVGEVERLLDQPFDVGRLPIAAAAARMRQHAFDNTVAAPAVLGNLFEIAGQHLDHLIALVTGIICERRHRRLGCLLQLLQ
jgi:hypothetical protein